MKRNLFLFTRTAIIFTALLIMGGCVKKISGENPSGTSHANPLSKTDNVDSIINVIEDSLRILVPRQIKDIAPDMPAYNVYNATVDGDFSDFTITYFFRFDESLSQCFLDHLKNKSSGWEKDKNENGETIFRKIDYKFESEAAERDGLIDSKHILVINPSKNNGYFKTVDF